ncbi:MAG: helix-turn-helix domain-containing protein [Candidatus Magasanikbacteria bacterium]|nr:helix-turn-helix domain-containing protein [Candidatus Magasanikbacteria bacterium]
MDQNLLTEKPKEVIRVSVSEAAKLFGVNAQTIRRAITSKEIIYIVVAGRYKLNFESLVKWSQRHTTIKNKLENKGIGQFIGNWKIKNPLYSPNPKIVNNHDKEIKNNTETREKSSDKNTA